jgi:hypothetical protein
VYRDLDPGVPYRICETDLPTSCLEVYQNQTASGASIRIASRSDVDRQKFYFERVSTSSAAGAYRMKSAVSGKYISVSGGSTAVGAGIIQETSSTSSAQRWNLREIKQGSYVLENQRSGLWIDDRNAPLGTQTVQTGGGSYYGATQMWKLTLEP